MEKNNFRIDNTYSISEIEVDSSWEKDFDTKYFEYRRKWERATNGHNLYEFPLFLEVATTTACNYKCPMCPIVILKAHKPRKLPKMLLEKLIRESKKEGLSSIALAHGSEPLMDKNLSTNMVKFREAGVLDILMHTNASLLSPEMSKKLIKSGLTKINFSLDATTEETYSKIRAGGDYKRVINNILSFLEIKKSFGKSYPRTRVSFICTNENVHERNNFYEFWKNKVNLIAFQKMRDYKKFYLEEENKKAKMAKNASRIDYKCSQLWKLLAVRADGNILPCLQDYNQQCVLGNLKNCTIKEAWHSEKMNFLRKMHSKGQWYKIPMCRKCLSCRSD